MQRTLSTSTIIGFLLFLCACSGTKNLPENAYLLKTNEIVIKDNSLINRVAVAKIKPVKQLNEKINTEIFAKLTDELIPLVKQKPNRLLVGFIPFHLAVYDLANKGRETKWKNWIKNTIGEEPVIYDSILTRKTKEQIVLYLNNKGYYKASVTDSVKLSNNRTATVKYIVTPEKPYTIRNIAFEINDHGLEPMVMNIEKASLLKQGENYDAEMLRRERERLAEAIKNEGYYSFSKEYIYFEVDSALGSDQVDILMGLNRINEHAQDTLIKPEAHEPFYIGKVSVLSDYNPKILQDTSAKKTESYKGLDVVFGGKLMTKPSTLYRNIFVRTGTLFESRNIDLTYKRISELSIYKFTNIRFKDAGRDSLGHRILDGSILLTPSYRSSFSQSIEGYSTGAGNPGFGYNISYRNKNTFRGAEIFEIKLNGGFEEMKSQASDSTNAITDKLQVVNTIRISPEVSLLFPRFLVPWKTASGRDTRPRTTLSSSYNFQQTPDFVRTVANISYGYSWNKTNTKRWIVNPAEVNLVDIRNMSQDKINSLSKQSLAVRNTYNPHFIPSGRYSYIINTQNPQAKHNFSYFRLTLEAAGNALFGATKLINAINKTPDRTYAFPDKNTDFSQYLRPDMDFRKYWILNQNNTLVYHLGSGIGFPYGNSKVMPFEKSFIAGGANDMRGWRIGELGPGSFSKDSITYDRIGDFKLITNLEYRFNLIKYFQSAVFIDAGNIWTKDYNATQPGSQLTKEKILKDFAIDAGPGLRLDLSFFVIRLDYGIQIKNPGNLSNEQWLTLIHSHVAEQVQRHGRFQFGVGYAF